MEVVQSVEEITQFTTKQGQHVSVSEIYNLIDTRKV